VEFTAKPRQVQVMLRRVIEAGVPFAWFSADEIYGQPKYLQGVARNAAPVPLRWTQVRRHNQVILRKVSSDVVAS
jgi:SRSO17 transposase